jgi:SAM-dependent methyltransferase
MSSFADIAQRMRDAWNRMAREDARYYIAFGRRKQEDEEFAANAADVVRRIGEEFARLEPVPEARRFLEIGCGIGRLMAPLSAHCGEIHGVDIADDMIALGCARMAGVAHAHLHWTRDSDLSAFADAVFDLVYSYAVMQHLPDEAPFWRYLAESARVLRPGGVLLEQFNSHTAGREAPDCWGGIVVPATRVVAECARQGLRVVALEGAGTQYTWLTAIRRECPVPTHPPARAAHIVRVTGAAEALRVTAGGPSGLAELFAAGLAAEHCDLAHLGAQIADVPLTVLRTGPPSAAAQIQITLAVPETVPPGARTVGLTWDRAPISDAAPVTVEGFARGAPRVLAVADGIDLLSSHRILCGVAKLWVNNLSEPDSLRAGIGGQPMRAIEFHCEDAVDQRYQINLHMPNGGPAGRQILEVAVADSVIFSEAIDIAPIDVASQAPLAEPG